ncbi:hypothetical protein FNF27_06022 [Cafeteria roenbergensis]|uniref:Uncharacterized protein n=1 Tax=Cafeteria roenbergensis TaxID=33653 RepID=A0A5A8E4U5_CAFRO|nr:hypothetical protein FNF27_06022 [Cafeteria roenbergensis]
MDAPEATRKRERDESSASSAGHGAGSPGTHGQSPAELRPTADAVRMSLDDAAQRSAPPPSHGVLSKHTAGGAASSEAAPGGAVVTNDGHPQHVVWLVGAKCIFSQQLPKMPREYIVRLVMDRRHRTLLALRDGRVVGAICYRPFFEQRFAEIAFCWCAFCSWPWRRVPWDARPVAC